MQDEPDILLPLQPVQITVNPTPSLIIKYFIEIELQVWFSVAGSVCS